MRNLRQISMKNRQNYFFNSMINIKNFHSNLLSIGQISFKNIDFIIYHIEYITMESLGGANSLYLVFNNIDAYIEENNEDKYLIFASTDKNKEALENCTELWDETEERLHHFYNIRKIS